MLILRSHSAAETRAIAAALARLAAVDDVILLRGDMGAGKTVFAQGYAEGLGTDEPVTSPTFNLVHTYDSGRLVLHHADLYRLDRSGEVSDLGLGELVEGDGVLLVEWGEAAAQLLGDHLDVILTVPVEADGPEDDRIVSVAPSGDVWLRRWAKIENVLRPWVESETSC